MNEKELAYYLLGFFQMNDTETFSKKQQATLLGAVRAVQAHHESMFANYIEAVSDSPRAVHKLVLTYLTHDEPAKQKRKKALTTHFGDVFKKFQNIAREAVED